MTALSRPTTLETSDACMSDGGLVDRETARAVEVDLWLDAAAAGAVVEQASRGRFSRTVPPGT